ncbi:MAG: hypothetical protein FD169_909 [Bacillota bacterium]|nr:MAG: hypothetical protein FD169_909 [Bacillota bacterium]MBS3950810.1 hypothetical protein [Peptococcaceae bacterium]
MRIYDLIKQARFRSVSVVGLAKNAGKTVTLNSIIKQSAGDAVLLGLSSIGYDGEKLDVLSRLAKPRIAVREGTLLATAADTILRATAGLEILAATDFITALGEVLLVRAREAGYVEVAGPDSLAEMRQCIEIMHNRGCELVLVDGALDRIGSAAPTITEATIVATGAVAGGSLRKILTRTLHVVALFSLPIATEKSDLSRRQNLVHITADGVSDLPFKSALGHGAAVVEHASSATPYKLFVPGALTDSLVSELTHKPKICKNTTLISPDPTHIFCSPEVWQKFLSLGGRAEVLQNVKVLAVTVNPTSPVGRSYAPKEFAAHLAEALAPLPVYDLFLDEDGPIGYQ